MQVAQERALAGYRQDLERIEGAKRRNKMISKYHMVRFFGRLLFSFCGSSFIDIEEGEGGGGGGGEKHIINVETCFTHKLHRVD